MKRLSIGKLFRIGGIGGFEIRRKRHISTLFVGTLAYCLRIGGFEIRRKRGVRLLLLLLLFASCAKDSAQPEQPDSATTGRTIRKEVTVQVAPMQGSVGKDATRATTPLSEDEKKIHSLWVLQFAGTADGSLLVKKDPVTVSEITDGAFYFDFEELSGGGQITVYLLANMESTALDGVTENSTTLGTFKAINLGVTPLTEATMKTGGLPMIASQSFDYATSNPAAFALKSLLAKVSFQYTTAGGFTFTGVNLRAKNLASAVPVAEPAANASVQHPSEINYTGSLTLVGDATYSGAKTVCYLPENLSGQVAAITQDKDRGGSNVPAGAVYMNMQDNTLSPIAYSFYPGDGTASDFNLQRHHQYTFNMELKGMNFTDKRVTIDTANCFLVDADNTAYSFLATVMGNGVTTPDAGKSTTPEILPTALEPTQAVVLWEQSDPTGVSNRAGDVVKYVYFSDGYIHFTTGTKPGNAVIAALAADGTTILWSWHIWRPETNPGDVECYTPYPARIGRTFTMMGLNLGAFNNEPDKVKAYGLLYQWGRKDPFPGATSVNQANQTVAVFEGVVTENGYSFAADYTNNLTIRITKEIAIANPMRFYCAAKSTISDWLYTRQDNLWGNPYTNNSVSPNPDLGSKSIYDPCPYGYRVPPQDTWAQATTSNSNWTTNGRNLGVGTGGATYFYPATGFRVGDKDGNSGLKHVGLVGRYWSSSPFAYGNKFSDCLLFDNSEVEYYYRMVRINGLSVRCMKEE